jgi:hypothetical protein
VLGPLLFLVFINDIADDMFKTWLELVKKLIFM